MTGCRRMARTACMPPHLAEPHHPPTAGQWLRMRPRWGRAPEGAAASCAARQTARGARRVARPAKRAAACGTTDGRAERSSPVPAVAEGRPRRSLLAAPDRRATVALLGPTPLGRHERIPRSRTNERWASADGQPHMTPALRLVRVARCTPHQPAAANPRACGNVKGEIWKVMHASAHDGALKSSSHSLATRRACRRPSRARC